MIGKQIARWTMAWFASALCCLIASLGFAAVGLAGPGGWAAGTAMATVHLFALGWLCQMMIGALIQFTPVLCARPLKMPGLSLPALLLTGLGTAMLAAGFLSMDGWALGQNLLGLAPAIMVAGFGLTAAMLVPTFLAGQGLRQAEVRMVVLALIALAGLWGTGTAMALTLAGYNLLPVFIPDALPLHVLLGTGGFLTLAAFGVSYKLFAMFLLAPERDGPLRKAVFGMASLVVVLVLGLAGSVLAGGPRLPLGLPVAVAGAVTASLYLAEMLRLWRSRHRLQTEVNMRWSRAAMICLAMSAALMVPTLRWGAAWAEAAVFLALVGWLSTLTLAQMVKIVSFLTWIQVFAPQIGRRPVPLVSDLTDARFAGRCLGLWATGVACGTFALAVGHPLLFQVSAMILLVAVLGLTRELLAIRRLRHLDPARLPDHLPPLVLPVPLLSSSNDHALPA